MERINNFSSRKDRYEVRLDNYNSAVDKINANWGRPTQAALNSLEVEKEYLIREKAYLESEGDNLDEQISSFKERRESLNKKAIKFEEKSQQRKSYD